eukprot:CAMPEP_0116133354 /NCGR_PEP_ID=MMETSP0329-20121206/10059_1 /TAXON_ID=697910 /ORGANISM="Pseudo-nitzschia arenysensis, Strain B593" /LENGTH=330 /DNA_ID=CAMNT_0003627975 /DNA_START=92 /DNA_END=1081 /DNA_ORIENTATION=-
MAAANSQESETCGLERFILIVSYDGTGYAGFQRQSSSSSPENLSNANERSLKRHRPNNQNKKRVKNRNSVPVTVQETLEDALEFYTGLGRKELRARFAGRTDGGVHARGQVVVVSLPSSMELGMAPATDNHGADLEMERLWKIRKSINSRLPNDISVEDVSVCENELFDPRVDAKSKQYSYSLRYRELVHLQSSAVDESNPSSSDKKVHPICLKGGPHLLRTAFDANRVWLCPWALDDSKLKEYCNLLAGTHDYSAFVHKQARKTRDNRMTVDRLDFERVKFHDDQVPIWEVRFLVEAKGFGRSQVRNMVGFLVDACRGQFKDQESSPNW